jgi:hypothetical protein
LFLAIVLGSAIEDEAKNRRWNWLITFFRMSEGVLSEAKFLHGINALGKIFLETLFKQNLSFDEAALP